MNHTDIGHGFTVTHHPGPGALWLSWTTIEHHGDEDYEQVEHEVEIPTSIIPALVAQLIPAHAQRYPKRLDEMHHALLDALEHTTYHPRAGKLHIELKPAKP